MEIFMNQPNNIYFSGSPHFLPRVTLADYVHVPAPNHHFRRTPEEYILYLIIDGTMLMTEGDINYRLQPGDILLLDPSRCHFGHSYPSHVHYHYIHFQWAHLKELQLSEQTVQQKQIERRMQIISESSSSSFQESDLPIPKISHLEPDAFHQILRRVRQIQDALHTQLEYGNSIANCQLLTLFLEHNHALTDALIGASDRIDPVVVQIMDYLRNHASEKITGDSLENTFHSSFDYLNRKFKKNIGKTIFQYLNQFRIERSKQMLQSGIYSNAQIAAENGFLNEFYFSTVFKKYTGESPSSYKKTH